MQFALRNAVYTTRYPEHWEVAVWRTGYGMQRINYTLPTLSNKLSQHNVDVINLTVLSVTSSPAFGFLGFMSLFLS